MAELEIRILGSGDAFGSGGRMQSCTLLRWQRRTVLIDCGATSLTAMRRFAVEPESVDTVLISHLHGDHFGGVPFLILEGQFASKRTARLTIAGPPGTRDRVSAAREILYPGSSKIGLGYELRFRELPEGRSDLGGLEVETFPVEHPSGAPAYALRVTCGDRSIAYSGDTAWSEVLAEVARGCELFLCECYRFDEQVPFHLDYQTLLSHRHELECRRIVLTHLHADMIGRRDVELELAEDGKRITL